MVIFLINFQLDRVFVKVAFFHPGYFYATIMIYPIEKDILQNGLVVDDIWSGCIMVADDIALLSTRVTGLQSMLDSVNDYSKKWRFEFNPGNTVEVTFGESTRSNSLLKNGRKWVIGDDDVKEKLTWEHVGTMLSGSFLNKDRCESAAKKGKEVVSCLLSSGARPGGLNPICSVDLWRTVGLPRMLYGAELWWGLNKSDVEKLDIANRFAAKRIQGLDPNTRSVAAIGCLGLWTIEGYIDKIKLLFFHKLLTAPTTSIHKKLFVKRLFSFIYRLVEKPLGFVPDIVNLLHKYELYHVLQEYMDCGYIPPYLVSKKTIKNNIYKNQLER